MGAGPANLAPDPLGRNSCAFFTATDILLSELPREGRMGREQQMSEPILVLQFLCLGYHVEKVTKR